MKTNCEYGSRITYIAVVAFVLAYTVVLQNQFLCQNVWLPLECKVEHFMTDTSRPRRTGTQPTGLPMAGYISRLDTVGRAPGRQDTTMCISGCRLEANG